MEAVIGDKDPIRYLNSGSIIGHARDLRPKVVEIFNNRLTVPFYTLPHNFDDQAAATIALSNTQDNSVVVAYSTSLFFTMYEADYLVSAWKRIHFQNEEQIVFANKLNQIVPATLHFNGNSKKNITRYYLQLLKGRIEALNQIVQEEPKSGSLGVFEIYGYGPMRVDCMCG